MNQKNLTEPSLFFCLDCKNLWFSKSNAKHPSCSNCHKKRTKKVIKYHKVKQFIIPDELEA